MHAPFCHLSRCVEFYLIILISEYAEKDVDTYIKLEFPFPTVSISIGTWICCIISLMKHYTLSPL